MAVVVGALALIGLIAVIVFWQSSPKEPDVVGQTESEAQQERAFGAKEVIDSNGELPLTGTYNSKSGMLIISTAGSGWSGTKDQLIGMEVLVDGRQVGTAEVWANEKWSHKTFVSVLVVNNVPRGPVEIGLDELNAQTITDENDYYKVTVVELPSS